MLTWMLTWIDYKSVFVTVLNFFSPSLSGGEELWEECDRLGYAADHGADEEAEEGDPAEGGRDRREQPVEEQEERR